MPSRSMTSPTWSRSEPLLSNQNHIFSAFCGDYKDKSIDGVVQMILDATQKFDDPLTDTRLLRWHSSLFPDGYSGFSSVEVPMIY